MWQELVVLIISDWTGSTRCACIQHLYIYSVKTHINHPGYYIKRCTYEIREWKIQMEIMNYNFRTVHHVYNVRLLYKVVSVKNPLCELVNSLSKYIVLRRSIESLPGRVSVSNHNRSIWILFFEKKREINNSSFDFFVYRFLATFYVRTIKLKSTAFCRVTLQNGNKNISLILYLSVPLLVSWVWNIIL